MEPPNNGHVWDPAFLSFVERLPSFGGYFCIECINTRVVLVCPLYSFGVSFIEVHCTHCVFIELDMALAYWNIVMKERFKFLEVWCTFLTVSLCV